MIKMKTKNLLMGIVASTLFLTFSACKKENSFNNPDISQGHSVNDLISENGTNPDESVFGQESTSRQGQHTGYVYTESNDVGQNNILIFVQNANGTLTTNGITASGGTGSGTGLGSQGAVVLDENHHWLYAVNAGSNSVSSFEVDDDGSLELESTAGTSGIKPVSITVYHNILYTVNAGSDNIAGFKIGNNGELTPINGSVHSLSTTGAGAPRHCASTTRPRTSAPVSSHRIERTCAASCRRELAGRPSRSPNHAAVSGRRAT